MTGPTIEGWYDDLPRREPVSMWDAIVDQLRQRNDYKWAKVLKPVSGDGKPSQTSRAWLRQRYPDIEMYARRGQSGLWMRRRPPEGET